MGVSLIIPTLNEEKNLRLIFPRIPSWIDQVIVVDGYSQDRTTDVASQYGAKVLLSSGKKGEALRLGMSEASHEIVITMDGDGSQLPEELPRFIQGIESGYNVVFGSRFLKGGGSEDLTPIRRLGNGFFRLIVNLFWKTNYSEVCYGFMAFRKEVIPLLKLKAKSFDIEVEIKIQAAKHNLKILQIPSFEKKRAFGKGKLKTLRDGWIIFSRIMKEFFLDFVNVSKSKRSSLE